MICIIYDNNLTIPLRLSNSYNKGKNLNKIKDRSTSKAKKARFKFSTCIPWRKEFRLLMAVILQRMCPNLPQSWLGHGQEGRAVLRGCSLPCRPMSWGWTAGGLCRKKRSLTMAPCAWCCSWCWGRWMPPPRTGRLKGRWCRARKGGRFFPEYGWCTRRSFGVWPAVWAKRAREKKKWNFRNENIRNSYDGANKTVSRGAADSIGRLFIINENTFFQT